METFTTASLNLFERFNRWIQESIMVKLFSIGILIIILLIPTAWIQNLIEERQQRADEVMDEITSKWSGSQTISGPVLVVPFTRQEVIDKGKEGVEITNHIEKAFFLPDQLDIQGKVTPDILHRGIFDAVVYSTTLQIRSSFSQPDFKTLNIPENMIHWKDAYLGFGITDLRGITENPDVKVGETTLTAEPTSNLGMAVNRSDPEPERRTSTSASYTHYTSGGILAKLNLQGPENFNGHVSLNISLKGSKRLNFVPAGKTTSVKLSGTWNDPSFDGEFLPEARTISENGFVASWKVLHFNRPFSQQWVGTDQHLGGSEFGVKLLIPVDQYQKSIRTSKYGVLIILLTFISLFLVEVTQKVRIHPFQYILIGAALTIYYTLLLSISEHFGYNISYVVASLSTVGLISLYATTFLNGRKLSWLFAGLLTVFYTFIFVIIQEQDLSLLLGSIGLFIIIALLMYFSRKIQWYRSHEEVKG